MVAGLGGLTGPVLVTKTGAVGLTVPAQTVDGQVITRLTRFVEVWETEAGESHALALADTPAGQALLHLRMDGSGQGFASATVVLNRVVEALSWYGQLYFTTRKEGDESHRRLARWNRYSPDLAGELSSLLTFSSAPSQLVAGFIPDGPDQLFLASKDSIVWVNSSAQPGSLASSLQVDSDQEILTGVSVDFPRALFYTTSLPGSSQGRLYRREFWPEELSDGGFSPANASTSRDIPAPGAMSGEAFLTPDRLLRFRSLSDGTEQPLVSLVEHPDAGLFRPSHLERTSVLRAGVWQTGFLLDVRCHDGGFAPLFLDDTGKLSHRATESGFPFVNPAPWADSETEPGAARIPADSRGLYLVR